MRPPTIHDVAREAGVSRGTVSRVLNGGHNVSPAALDAVNAAIRKTGYTVNRHARSLITGRSDSVAFLLTEPQERFFEDPNFNVLLRGCTSALAAHDIPLLLMIAGTEAERRRNMRYIMRPCGRGPAGLQPLRRPGRRPAARGRGAPGRVREAARAGLEGELCGGRRPGRRPGHGALPVRVGAPPHRYGQRPPGHPGRRRAAHAATARCWPTADCPPTTR